MRSKIDRRWMYGNMEVIRPCADHHADLARLRRSNDSSFIVGHRIVP